MKNKHLLKCIVLFSICILVSGCTEINSENPVDEAVDYKDANLTLNIMPTELSINEISNLQLTLKNEGNFAVNVAKLEEHATYNIIYSNGSDIDYSEIPSMGLLGDYFLVELNPNDSLSINISTGSWGTFSKGNHSLSAKYFIPELNAFTKTHWSGTPRSNNITLIVE
jgi:hypothetical protein